MRTRALASRWTPLAIGLLAGLALLAQAAVALAESIHDRVSTFTLDNGLQIVVIPDHRAPVVTHMIWYRIGSTDEPAGTSGVAHFLEHLLFKGTTTYPDGGFSERVAAIGGDDNAFTTSDATGYHQSVAREHLGLMMEFEADRMVNLQLSDDDIFTERDVILEERRQRIDNNPSAKLREAMSAALFQNSRYGVPIIGWQHEMEALSRRDALDFYDRYYAPNNAVVVVAGDTTAEEVRDLAEASYGKLARRNDLPPRVDLSEPAPTSARTVTYADERVNQPLMNRLYLVPSYSTAEAGEAEALSVLSEILGGGTTSRLYTELVVDGARAVGAGAGYNGGQRGPTTFGIYGIPRGELTLDDIEADLDAQIARLKEDGVTEKEVAAAKRRARAGTIYAQDSASSIARTYGRAIANGRTVDDVRTWLDRIEAVTVEDVNAVARKFLDKRRSVTGYLVGADEEEQS